VNPPAESTQVVVSAGAEAVLAAQITRDSFIQTVEGIGPAIGPTVGVRVEGAAGTPLWVAIRSTLVCAGSCSFYVASIGGGISVEVGPFAFRPSLATGLGSFPWEATWISPWALVMPYTATEWLVLPSLEVGVPATERVRLGGEVGYAMGILTLGQPGVDRYRGVTLALTVSVAVGPG
jgi:hypothetical protein